MTPCPWCSCTLGHEPGCLGAIPAECRREARIIIEPDLNELQKWVLQVIHDKPGTDEQLCQETGLQPNTLRPRRVELAEAGLIVPAGKARTRSGRMATVWRAAR